MFQGDPLVVDAKDVSVGRFEENTVTERVLVSELGKLVLVLFTQRIGKKW